MGNFLAIVSSGDCQDEADRLFHSGLAVARCIKSQVPSGIVETDWVRAASFARQNGSGTPIVSDSETGSWLLAIGTWFHTEDYGAGAESRLLSRYLEVGPVRLGQELEGFFVIVVGDARTRETIILTDIVGSCHCFARSWKNIIAVSGSSLLLAGLGDFSLDPVGCQEFLCTGIVYEDRTFYREVHKLGPSTVFWFVEGALKAERRYWQITNIAPESLDGQTAVKALGETLIHAAQRVGRLFALPVCDLTGGYDSRALVTAFLTAGVQFATTVSGPATSPDVIISRDLAQVAGLLHLHLVAQQEPASFNQAKKALPLTDGEYDLVEYARVLEVHRTLSEHFDISVNGSFGEVARGHWWDLLFPRTGERCKLDAQRLAKLRYAAQSFDASLFPPETRLDLVSHFCNVIERTNAGLFRLPNTLQMDHAYLMMRMQRWQGRIASSTNQLWPCLSPFLFRSILETMLQTTTRLRQRSLLIRRMLAEYQPRLAAFPLEHGYPALPATWKTIHRFWPLPVHYGRKILSKVIRKCGGSWRSSVSRSSCLPARLQLWREEEVRELLYPAAMRLGRLVDTAALGDFLRYSQRQNFPFSDQWTRVLSLEYTLSVLEHAKADRHHE